MEKKVLSMDGPKNNNDGSLADILPPEIIGLIFDHAFQSERFLRQRRRNLARMCRVSRRWYDVGVEYLYKDLEEFDIKLSERILEDNPELIRFCKKLAIDFDTENYDISLLQYAKTLEWFIIRIDKYRMNPVLEAIQGIKSLTHIHINPMSKIDTEFCVYLPSLTTLKLCYIETRLSQATVFSILKGCPNLINITFDNILLTYAFCQKLPKYISRAQSLNFLRIEDYSTSTTFQDIFSNIVENLPDLQELTLDFRREEDLRDVQVDAEWVKKSNLRILTLLNVQSVEPFLRQLIGIPLEQLDLSGIGDPDPIFPLLSAFPGLITLSIYEDYDYVAKRLPDDSNIKYLFVKRFGLDPIK